MSDQIDNANGAEAEYGADSIKVLKGLDAVRKRPGMYIGDTDDGSGLHHMVYEVVDNAIDEALAGHADLVTVTLNPDGSVTVIDNGRGIPVDPHPKFKKPALEVIMTTLHSGGKFDSKVYETSGGLHGVGVSVVNALSDHLEVEVARGRQLYRQRFSRGVPVTGLEQLGEVHNRRGTRIRFHPDEQIFGKGAAFEPARLYRMTRSKAYLFGG
ncbi:MAG: DNA topoisomerase IV subunit B, partial [Mesorhizobium sp.]